MAEYHFSLIVPAPSMSDDQILEVADKLAEAGCDDSCVGGHADGMELVFDRSAESMQLAIASAIADVELAGLRVRRVEMQRESIPT